MRCTGYSGWKRAEIAAKAVLLFLTVDRLKGSKKSFPLSSHQWQNQLLLQGYSLFPDKHQFGRKASEFSVYAAMADDFGRIGNGQKTMGEQSW